jgi:hypothetical protein
MLEFAGLSCITQLLRRHAKSISGALRNPIVDKLNQFPAFQFLEVLCAIFLYITVTTFEWIYLAIDRPLFESI